MPRTHRKIEAGIVYHVLNRGNGRRPLFSKESDFNAFIKLLNEALARFEVDLLAYCLMGNHWHLLVRPRTDKALSKCMGWIAVTHARRHHKHYPNPGSGHLYQGRFKSFPVQSDEHFLIVARYIHANPVHAGSVQRAADWRWNDLTSGIKTVAWPVERPRDWARFVDRELPEPQKRQLEKSMNRGSPFGSATWVRRIVERLGLGSTLRERGRPRKAFESLSLRQQRRRRKKDDGGGQKSR